MTRGLDETDVEILKRLEESSDRNLEELAEELDCSPSTIHYRIAKLKEEGVITEVSADLDPAAFGLDTLVLTEVTVSHEGGYADEIGEALTEIAGVNAVYYTMGDVDFVVIAQVQDREQLYEMIDAIVTIDGVDETSSRFVIRELKAGNRILNDMSDEMVDRVIDGEGGHVHD